MSLLDRVSGLLADRAVPHALIGAAALAVRGIARSTFDVSAAPDVLLDGMLRRLGLD